MRRAGALTWRGLAQMRLVIASIWIIIPELLDLTADAAEGVVDRLRSGALFLGNLLVGLTLGVADEHAPFELAKVVAEQSTELSFRLPRDDDLFRIDDLGIGDEVTARFVALVAPARVQGGGVGQGELPLPPAALHRGDHLPRNADAGEGAERAVTVGAEVTDGLKEADHALLDHIIAIGAMEEVGAGLI